MLLFALFEKEATPNVCLEKAKQCALKMQTFAPCKKKQTSVGMSVPMNFVPIKTSAPACTRKQQLLQPMCPLVTAAAIALRGQLQVDDHTRCGDQGEAPAKQKIQLSQKYGLGSPEGCVGCMVGRVRQWIGMHDCG